MEPTWVCRVFRRVIISTPVDSYPMTDDGSTELAEARYPITKTKGPFSFGRRSSVIGGRRPSTFIEL
jgi:hypothetical protein